jgi:hypothetical protein
MGGSEEAVCAEVWPCCCWTRSSPDECLCALKEHLLLTDVLEQEAALVALHPLRCGEVRVVAGKVHAQVTGLLPLCGSSSSCRSSSEEESSLALPTTM